MTLVSYSPKYGCIKVVSTYTLSVVYLPIFLREHGFLGLPQELEEDFGASLSSGDFEF